MRLGALRTTSRAADPLQSTRKRSRFLADVEHLAEAAAETIDQLHAHGMSYLADPLERALRRMGGS
jgi:hypothetical protein